MKIFKYKFSKLQTALIIVGLVLCGVGFGVNLFYCIRDGVGSAPDPIYPILQYSLLFFITIALFVLLISILTNSAYVIDGKIFKTRFGIIISKYDTEKIVSATLDRKTDKLTVTFESGEFMIIVVKQDWYGEFIDELLKANPKIEYSIISKESGGTDTNGDDKKA